MTMWTDGGLEAPICVACGTQFPPGGGVPERCPICSEDRQYIPDAGQLWTTLGAELGHHHNAFEMVEAGVIRIGTEPTLGIGQGAFLVETRAGRVLWDLVGYVDETTVAAIARLGGVDAIAISHPHFHTTMVEWSHALGDVPVLLHEGNRPWVQRHDERIRFWSGDTHALLDGVTLVRTGGHFPGSTVMHVDGGVHATEHGLLFTGDTMAVKADRHMVAFLYSYPNDIPLDPGSVRRIAAMVGQYRFARIYGAFPGEIVPDRAAEVVRESAERYVRHVTADPDTTIG